MSLISCVIFLRRGSVGVSIGRKAKGLGSKVHPWGLWKELTNLHGTGAHWDVMRAGEKEGLQNWSTKLLGRGRLQVALREEEPCLEHPASRAGVKSQCWMSTIQGSRLLHSCTPGQHSIRILYFFEPVLLKYNLCTLKCILVKCSLR